MGRIDGPSGKSAEGGRQEVEGCGGQEKRNERVPLQRLEEVAVKQASDGPGSAAARAQYVECTIERAAGVDVVTVGWIEVDQCSKTGDCGYYRYGALSIT